MPRPSQHNSPLAQFRKKMRITQAGLAAILGISRESVSKLESKNEIPAEFKKRIKEEFDEESYRWLNMLETTEPEDQTNCDNLYVSCGPCMALQMPVTLKIEEANPNSETVADVSRLLAQLITLPENKESLQIQITVSYKASFFDTRQELMDNLFACLLKNNESVLRQPRRAGESSDSANFVVQTTSPHKEPVTVSICGLDRFPKVSKVPFKLPDLEISGDPFQRHTDR